jgi:thiamine-monophosphate kinase
LGKVKVEEVVLRSGARAGEAVLVTGWLGGGAAGLALLERRGAGLSNELKGVLERYLTPMPRVGEGRVIARSGRVTSMIDVSDGLSSDVGHICDESGVGVRLFADRLPLSGGVCLVAEVTGRAAWMLALQGGEDYELCLTVPPEAEEEVAARVEEETGTPVTCVGEILPRDEGRWVVLPDGSEIPLVARGWDHFGAGP